MRRRLLLSVALLGCLGMPAAQAESVDREGWRYLAQRSQDRDAQRRGNRREERRDDERQRRRDADRQQQRESLTPDERRELNRDLQRANREIYRKGRDKR